MQILRDRDVALAPDLRRYRETSWRSLLTGFLLLIFVAGVVTFLTLTGSWSSPWASVGFLIWAAIMALPIHLCFRTFRASRRPENWLLAWAPDRIYLRFRSFQNHRFDPETHSVACIARREIAWIRIHTHMLETQDFDGNWNAPIKIKGLQIKLKADVDTIPLSAALKEEAKRRDHKHTRFDHHPVTLRDGSIVFVELRRPQPVLKDLAPYYTMTTDESIPLSRFDKMSPDEKETHILDLVLAGQKIDAIKAAREVYGYDTAEAKRMVESLVER